MPRKPVFVVLASLALAASGCGGGGGAGAPAASTTTAPAPPTTSTARETRELPSSLVGAEWRTVPTRAKVVALTFDGGANAAGAPAILAALERAHAPATFFLTGRWVETFPEPARAIGAGFVVGNHTYDHLDLTALPPRSVRTQVERAERAIVRVTGQSSRPLLRFPFGARNAATIELVNELGYGSIAWTVDTLGWQGTDAGRSAASVRARVLRALEPGAIVLMHVGAAPDGSTLDADALPQLISAVRARGYRLVGLDRYVR